VECDVLLLHSAYAHARSTCKGGKMGAKRTMDNGQWILDNWRGGVVRAYCTVAVRLSDASHRILHSSLEYSSAFWVLCEDVSAWGK
jgi:hypothetical protein